MNLLRPLALLLLFPIAGLSLAQDTEREGVVIVIEAVAGEEIEGLTPEITNEYYEDWINTLSEVWTVTSSDEARYQLSISPISSVFERCNYGSNTTVIRRQISTQITVIDIPTSETLASAIFSGSVPTQCSTFENLESNRTYYRTGNVGLFIPIAGWLNQEFVPITNLMPLPLPFRIFDNGVGFAFSPDGNTFIVKMNFDMVVFDIETEAELFRIPHVQGQISYSPNGRLIAATIVFGRAGVWDAVTGEHLFEPIGHTDDVNSISFSPNGRLVVTGSMDKTARVWDVDTGEQLLQLTGHTNTVYGTRYSPDGRLIVTHSSDDTARVWDAETGEQLLTFEIDTSVSSQLTFSPDGRLFVVTNLDERRTMSVWNAETREESFQLAGHEGLIRSVRFSPDNRFVITGSTDNTARVWDAETGEALLLLVGHSDNVTDASYSPDGRFIVTTSDDETARLWDAEIGEEIYVLSGYSLRITRAEFSPDGQSIFTYDARNLILIWDISDLVE